MSRLKVGELFAGYGGLGLGLAQVLDTETAWVSDIDKGANKILAHRFPDVPNHGDLTKIDWAAVEPVDIITGGFPCQDLSHAGKRAGMGDGTRSGLWSYMCEAIDVIRPYLVVAENVRGLLSAEARREPNAKSCVCGGTDRRGRVRGGASSQADVSGSRRGGDDPASQTDLGATAFAVGRLASDDAGSDRSLGRGMDLDDRRPSGRSTAVKHRAVPADQEASGPVGAGDRGAEARLAEATEWELGLERGNAATLSANQGGTASPESSRPETCRICGGLTDGGAPTGPMEPCPFCVGDGPDVDLRALGAVLADLADIGYDAQWVGLRAADVGACHGRFRVFLVAHPRCEPGEVPTGQRLAAVAVASGDGDPGGTRRLLPTLRTSDANGVGTRGEGGVDLRPAVSLLPTPAASRAGGTAERYLDRLEAADGSRRTNCSNLDLVVEGDPSGFGQYATAIDRWETVTGRPAPSSTEPAGRNGAQRLSPKFTEWMMGLPAGWITDVPGITRSEALKACGNGVVPQQAAAALRHMLATSQAVAA